MIVPDTDDQHLIRAPYVLRVINFGNSNPHIECKIVQTLKIHLSLLEQIVVEAYSLTTLSKFIAILATHPANLYTYMRLCWICWLMGGALDATTLPDEIDHL
jgi:hypothetical protein